MYEDELLKAIQEAEVETSAGIDNDALTAMEIASVTGIPIIRVRSILKGLIDNGVVEPIWVYRDSISTSLTGKQQKRPGFRKKV
jgi:hypothetical protein